MLQPTDVTIILTAGRSSRLGHLAFDRPKTLLSICGQTLLERLCRQFAGSTRRFVIVAGSNYRFIAEVISDFGLPITVIGGDQLTSLGNAASLRAGLDSALGDLQTRCHILEADVLMSSQALEAYFALPQTGCLCIPLLSDQDDRLYRTQNSTLAISKTPQEPAEILGKFLGVSQITADQARQLHAQIKPDSQAPYTEALSKVLAADFQPVQLASDQAMEIDTAEDYRTALLHPSLAKRGETVTIPDKPRLSLNGHLKRLVGVHDVFGARMTQRAGFDGLWLGSFQITLASGGKDDASYSPLQAVQLAEQLQSTGNLLPIVIDIGNGFRDNKHQQEFIQRAKAAGVAAICVEDNDDNRVCSLNGSSERKLISAQAFADRIAKLADDTTGEIKIIARTEALTLPFDSTYTLPNAIESARKRLDKAVECGADFLLPHYISGDITAIQAMMVEPFSTPCLFVPTGLLDVPLKSFKEMGFAAVVYANLDLRLRFKQLQDVYAQLNAFGALSAEKLGHLADPKTMQWVLNE